MLHCIRKLKAVERLPFLKKDVDGDVIERMVEYIDRGISIIIEFGNFTSTFCYLLIANIITRRLHSLYIQKTEHFLGTHKKQDEPKKLMITIEEAHKFLNPQTAHQTIFGTIAREMRKYYVSLLSSTSAPQALIRKCFRKLAPRLSRNSTMKRILLAVLTGVAGSNQLRTVLAGLDSKKQALLLGHAVAMPVVIQTREYDEKFYTAVIESSRTQIC